MEPRSPIIWLTKAWINRWPIGCLLSPQARLLSIPGNQFPQWKNNLLLGSLAAQELLRLVLDGDRGVHQEILFKGIGRVRDIVIGPDSALYVVLNQPDRIERIVPVAQ